MPILFYIQAGAKTARSLASAASVLSPVYSKCARRYKGIGLKPPYNAERICRAFIIITYNGFNISSLALYHTLVTSLVLAHLRVYSY
jgi:hypothetical protein